MVPPILDALWHRHLCPPGIWDQPRISSGKPQSQSAWPGVFTQAHTPVFPGILEGEEDGKYGVVRRSYLGQSPPQVTSAMSQPCLSPAAAPPATLFAFRA